MLYGAVGAFFINGLFYPEPASAAPLMDMELEALMDLEVTSVSKRVQPLSDSPAAVYVITSEEIRRSGATSVADVLRLAPGVEVAKLNASTWAISIRGLNSMYSHNLLVLVDGRSIYSPLYGGVYWDAVMPMLEDIERIEVIRGPGASLWGVNAVNGVINIISRSSELTQGYRAVVAAGNEENHLRLRSGGQTGQLFYRGYAVHRDVDDGRLESDNSDARDDMEGTQAGTRADWLRGDSRVTVQGDLAHVNKNYNHAVSEYLGGAKHSYENLNGNVLARWTQSLDGNEIQTQLYYDYTRRDEPGYVYRIHTYDLDLQYNHQRSERHRLTWGFNYRYFADDMDGNLVFDLSDAERHWDLVSGFIQDEYRWSERLTLVAGVKAEKVKNIDTAWQPTLRFNYRLDDNLSFWGSVSAAERIPTRQDRYAVLRGEYPEYLKAGTLNFLYDQLTAGLTPAEIAALEAMFPQLTDLDSLLLIGVVRGNEALESEKNITYELGTRWQPAPNVFFDMAAFYSRYRDMRALEYEDWTLLADTVITELRAITLADARSEGVELAFEWRPSRSWRYKLHYNYLNFVVKNDNAVLAAEFLEGTSPQHQVSFRTYWDINDSFQLDLDAYYVEEITSGGVWRPQEYGDLNARFAWRRSPRLTVSLVGRNLFRQHRYEYQETLIGPEPTAIDRSIYLQFDWKQ
ncbi:MAG: TonB-dependent receptor [Ketobacteraceae bacterium]|nr:TonB-dependent receptor [Ketobacteraceae bacterium]